MKAIAPLLLSATLMSAQAQVYDKPDIELKDHNEAVQSVVFSPDGKYLISGSDDKTAILWDLTSKEPIKTLQGNITGVKALAVSPDGQYFFISGDRNIKQFDYSGNFIQSFGGNNTYLWMLSVSPDSKSIVCGSFDMYPRLWNILTPEKKPQGLKAHKKNALVARFSPNGKYIATGSLDLSIIIWSVDSLKPIHTLRGSTANIFDIQWLSDSKRIASGSADKMVKIWDVENPAILLDIRGHQDAVVSLAISKNDYFILSASNDQTVCMWDASNGKCLHTYTITDKPNNAVALSNDNKWFAIASGDKLVRLYEFNPYFAVDYYYSDMLISKTDSIPMFRPKGKDEKKDAYELRMKKAQEMKKGIYEELFKKYELEYQKK